MNPHLRATPTLTAAAAQLLIDAATAEATRIGVPMCIAVVDPAGDLLAFRRMDGAKGMSIATCKVKAVTSARSGGKSGPLPDNLGLSLGLATGGSFTDLRGGRPVLIDGQCVGAIGVGSGTPEQDVTVADAALAALEAP
jgi:uncharacterized protein GlcG (DUF336 family)